MAESEKLPAGFTRRAREETRGDCLDLVRAKLKLPLKGIILSENLLVRETHYWKRRTMPCNGLPNCEACMANLAPRATGYLACFCEANGKTYIYEVPENSTWAVVDYKKLHYTLRGHHVMIERIPPRINGRCRVTFHAPLVERKILPPCPNVIAALCRMWGMKDWQMLLQIFPADNQADPNTKPPIERQA